MAKPKVFQREIVKTDAVRADVEDGVKRRRGRRFIRWSFGRMWVNNTSSVLTKFRQKKHSAFYVRYSCAYVIGNNETRLINSQKVLLGSTLLLKPKGG